MTLNIYARLLGFVLFNDSVGPDVVVVIIFVRPKLNPSAPPTVCIDKGLFHEKLKV